MLMLNYFPVFHSHFTSLRGFEVYSRLLLSSCVLIIIVCSFKIWKAEKKCHNKNLIYYFINAPLPK